MSLSNIPNSAFVNPKWECTCTNVKRLGLRGGKGETEGAGGVSLTSRSHPLSLGLKVSIESICRNC